MARQLAMIKFFARPFRLAILLVGAVAVASAIFWGLGREDEPEFVLAKRQDVVEEVSATGRVKSASSVNLAFDRSGRVARVFVRVGDAILSGSILVQLENADLLAQLAEAEANIKAQRAKLDEVKRGTRPEEVEVQAAKVADARQILVARIQDAYTKSDDAVRNKADQFISSPRSSSPTLNLSFSVSAQLKSDIESLRVELESLLVSWKSSLNGLSPAAEIGPHAASAKTNLERIKVFLDLAALAVSAAIPNTGLPQATLDGYRSDVSTARSTIETAILNLTSAGSNLTIQEREFILKQAPPLPEKISAQEAAYEEALAKAGTIKAQIAKTAIRSPLNGTVSAVGIKVGEIVSANAAVVSVISTETLQIEVNVPEADVATINVGQTGDVTLDAYGSGVAFRGRIVAIDPAETIVEGVATYRTILQFTQPDERIKSGMSANIDIVTDRRPGVITIPQRAVATKNGDTKAKILMGDGTIEERSIVIGLRGSDGSIEIVEGIREGERVVVVP